MMFFVTIVLVIFNFFLAGVLYFIRSKERENPSRKCARTLIVLGSGGHTSEMIRHLIKLDPSLYQPRLYVVADSDSASKSKVKSVELRFHEIDRKYSIEEISRSRNVVAGTEGEISEGRIYWTPLVIKRKSQEMPLKGIKVIELAGLAPGPFCGMLLADFGASVIRVDKTSSSSELDSLRNGKKSLAINLKSPKGVEILKRLSAKSDVLIEPFRKGVMESLGLGPDVLMSENPRLIYARLTGFGQTGPYATKAGHDINFVALSGLLSFLGRKNEKPTPPVNLLADFAGGGLLCAFGILLSLFERSHSGKGQVIDSAMVDGAAYLGSWLFRSQNVPIWGQPRGCNVLDTGSHFYDTYKTKDGKYIAVGALENQFYMDLIDKLKVDGLEDQFSEFESKKEVISKIISEKTRDEWCSIFEDSDACVTPVLEVNELIDHPYNKERNIFFRSKSGLVVPKPAPWLSRTPGETKADHPETANGSETQEILMDLGYTQQEIAELKRENVIKQDSTHSKL